MFVEASAAVNMLSLPPSKVKTSMQLATRNSQKLVSCNKGICLVHVVGSLNERPISEKKCLLVRI